MLRTIARKTYAASALLSLCCSTSALAAPGDGIQTETLSLDLGLDAISQVNTNLFYAGADETNIIATSLLVQPTLSLDTLNPKAVDFDANVRARWQQYLSGNQAVLSQSGFSTDLNTAVTFNPSGNFSLRLEDTLVRTNEAPNTPTSISYNRLQNNAGIRLGVHPGGRVFQGFLSYNFSLFNFSEPLEDLNKVEHTLRARFVYKFFPRTAALISAEYRFINYAQDIAEGTEAQSDNTLSLVNIDSQPLRITAGLSGLLTNRIAANIDMGYGSSRYDFENATLLPNELLTGDGAIQNVRRFIAQGSLTYQFGPALNNYVRGGFRTGFEDSILGLFYTYNAPYVELRYLAPDQRLSFNVDASFERRVYVIAPATGTNIGVENTRPVDPLLSVQLTGGYKFKPWLTGAASYRAFANFTNDSIIPAAAAPGTNRSFFQNLINLTLTAQY